MTPASTAVLLMATMVQGATPQPVWSDASLWRDFSGVKLRGAGGAFAEVAAVKALWNEQWLFVAFDCADKVLVSPGTKDGLDHFKLGDVAEVFVARAGAPFYLEAHATPAGKKTVYCFDGYRKSASPPAASRDIVVKSAETERGWRALVSLPWAALGGDPERGPWEILAGRYDYDTTEGKPVLSSFPAQTLPADFHDRARFARLELRR
ncbi:MAG: hypothetical protein FGM15_04695 [Chthoniobacterales bacterium]|nr:hypothetical protein [Chthoniobacterales bacterium]